MELALPRFAMTEGPRRVHPPWLVVTSFSSVYLNLDALTSSSNEESLDVNKCKSDDDLPAVFGARDIRQVFRRRDRPPDGPIRRTTRSDCRQEPSAPVVDLVTGKCNPGKVSTTVSTSPLTLDMTVMCIPELDNLQPMAVT